MSALWETGRILVYFAAVGWMICFTRSVSPRVRRAATLFYAGLGIEVLSLFLRWGSGPQYGAGLARWPYAIGLLAIVSAILVLGSMFLIMLEISRTSQRLKRDAEIDHLTGLFNRRVFFERAEEALSDARAGRCRPSVAVLDVDNMKEINDVHGHQCGDEVLRHAARALRLSVRHDDVPARYGGDEFGVLFVDSGPNIETLKDRLAHNLAGSRVCGGSVAVSVSVGIARYPVDGKDIDALLWVADSMMYADKSNNHRARRSPLGDPVHQTNLSQS
ncbi:MAG: GGDEF domain-containing protein [Firmicutes bacterium]|nr:GGDEF domain-containing protein [Bacillota bacterium]